MQGEIIYEYGKNPVNWGRLQNPDLTHTEKNISCGEEITVDFCFEPNGTIREIGFEGEGRLITFAAMSLLTEELEGKELAEVESYQKAEILELLETDQLSPRRLKSALLGLLTLKNALRKQQEKPQLDFGDLSEQ